VASRADSCRYPLLPPPALDHVSGHAASGTLVFGAPVTDGDAWLPMLFPMGLLLAPMANPGCALSAVM